MKKKSIIRRLLPWIIFLAAIAALVLFVFVPIYSRTKSDYGRETEIYFFAGDGKPLTMETDQLLFEMDGETSLFKVTNKNTGKVWYSNPEGRENDTHAQSQDLKAFLSCTLDLSYYSDISMETMNNFTGSIKNQSFVITQEEDNGSIRVDYSIGKNAGKKYLVPNVITKERFDAFLGNMKKGPKNRVKGIYTAVDPKKLGSQANKDEILATYPIAAEQAVYIMKSDTNATQKEEAEEAFVAAGYTEEDYETDQQLMVGEKETAGPVFNVSVIYSLEGPDLVVRIPYDEIRCRAEYPVVYVSPLPMFGAAGKTQEGFSLIPEGGGAILKFNNGKVNQEAYFANNYGWDYGRTREKEEVVSETEIAFPVFGMSHEDGSFICIMEGADAYGGIAADISGRLNDFNTVYGKYNVIHYDTVKVDAKKSAKKMLMYEDAIPNDTLIQRYRILDDNSYVSMAHAYGDYLEKKMEDLGMMKKTASEDMPVNVELIGAINKREVKAGLPVNSVITTTSFDEAEQIISDFLEGGVKDLNVRYTGWCNGGVQQKVLTGIHVEGGLGGEGGMKKLIDSAKQKDVDLYFDGISCFAYDSDIFDGFIALNDASRTTTRAIIKLYPYDIVTFRQSDWMDPYYLVKPAYANKCTENLINGLKDRGAAGVAFRDIGNLLSADYHDSAITTREQVKAMHVQSLKNAVGSGLKVTIKEGNTYAIPYADVITDMNLTGNRYALLDDFVPFYQIALHGLKNYTGQAINLAGDYKTLLLECAEYGAGLNFSFMNNDTKVLQDSVFSCYASSGYGPWRQEAMEIITRYQKEMAGLNRQPIVGHEQLSSDVAVTLYENGTKVYVNYSTTDFSAGAVTVPARDYVVEREVGQ